MSTEQRREMIVRTALPLIAERGSAVTTQQVAKAAGIGEATIFRAFATKEELLDACVVEVMRPDHVLDAIAAIPADQPLAERLTEAAMSMRAYTERIGAVFGALHASGHRSARGPRRPGGHEGHARPDAAAHERTAGSTGGAPDPAGRAQPPRDRGEAFAETLSALETLLEPDRDRLRLPVDRAASIFLHLMLVRARPTASGLGSGQGPGGQFDIGELVDLFLHGALDRSDTAPAGAAE